VQLGWTQEILGPVQPQVGIGTGERWFGWDGLLGVVNCFDWESEGRGGRGKRPPGGVVELQDCFYGIRGRAGESFEESGQFLAKFTEDCIHGAKNQRLLSQKCMPADRQSSFKGRLVAFKILI